MGQVEPRSETQACRGAFDEITPASAAGWAQGLTTPGMPVAVEIVLADGEVVGAGHADAFRADLLDAGIGDGRHGFRLRLDRAVTPAERAGAALRAAGAVVATPAPAVAAWEPVRHVAMDIVDNCNLRCPFCLYDYAHTRTTNFMEAATLDAALQFLPYTRDGEFWFSCLHEPTLHPRLMEFVDRVPAEYRRKLFFTTNLAKRMPAEYFTWLANARLHHINVSIESLDPALYERMRKGARHRIFAENWDRLVAALDATDRPTPVRYIAMAYRSNLRELPGLVAHLLSARRAAQVELRYTYDVAHLPPGFREAEFLNAEDWAWLSRELACFTPEQVRLELPPAEAVPPPPGRRFEQDFYLFRLSWDGSLRVFGLRAGTTHETEMLATNIRAVGDAPEFLWKLGAFAEG